MRRTWPVVFLVIMRFASAAGDDDAVAINAAQREALGVVVGVAGKASERPVGGLVARVRVPLADSAVVTAPFEGVVVKVLAREGRDVEAGEALALVRSRSLMTLQADLASARAEHAAAAAEARRDRMLVDEGIAPASRAEASTARRAAAGARVGELDAAARLAPRRAGFAPGTYEIAAPVSGRVLERDVEPGQAIDALAKAFLIAPPAHVEIELRLPLRYRDDARIGQVVRASDGSEARVVEVGAAIDPASQSVRLRAEAVSSSLVPGQQTTATLWLPAPADAVRLPTQAIVRRGRDSLVFVESDGGFRAVSVEVIAEGAENSAIVRGPVASGARVAVAGASALKAMLGTTR